MTAHEVALKMNAYMAEYSKKPKAERAIIARTAFIRSGMIDENGEFTDHYAYSREYHQKKREKK